MGAEFIDRQEEMQTLDNEYARKCSSFVVLYGRRRVGKTTLISEFIKNKNALFFLATEEAEPQNRRMFKEKVAEFTGNTLLKNAEVDNRDEIFKVLVGKTYQSKLIIVIDEFQHIGRSNAAFSSIFQRIWEEILKNVNVMVIICGSLISMMESQVLAYNSPLYGRRTAQIKLKQIPFKYYKEFFSNRSDNELIERYAVTGGVPKYIELFTDESDIYNAIYNNILSKSGYLYDEPNFLLRQEVMEVGSYFSIIRAIAAGNSKLSDIAKVLEIKATSLTKYLGTLIDLDILEREVPVTEDNPEKSKKGLYKIKDNYIRFWFAFVYPNMSFIEAGNSSIVLEKIKNNFIDRLPVIHTDALLSVLKCFTGRFKKLNENDFFGSEMWHETYAVRDGIIKAYDGEIEKPEYCVLSGPNIGEANMYSKQPRINCSSKGDYDNISLDEVVSGQCVVPRVKYIPADSELYSKNLPVVDGVKFDEKYRIVFRKMLSKSSELNLKCTLIPPKVSYVNSIVGYSFRDEGKMVYLSGLLNSLVYIYLINSTGKMNFTSNTISIVPVPDNQYKNAIMLRGLRLNAISPLYANLLKHVYTDEFQMDKTLISSIKTFLDCNITNEWNELFAIWRDLDRYITMVELDVLAAKGIGMTLKQLIDLYSINYPNMDDNEKNTWYDQEGKIVFTTNKSFVKYGVSKEIWEKNKDKSFSDTDLLGINRNYVAPYFRTDRVSLYKEAWDMASKLYE